MIDRIVVYSPQIYENYTLKSGEGLSVLFVIVWLLGDLTNLIGAVLGGLLPTIIILALYVRLSISMYIRLSSPRANESSTLHVISSSCSKSFTIVVASNGRNEKQLPQGF